MKAIRRAFLAAPAALALTAASGCVVVVGDGRDGGEDWEVSWAGGQEVVRVGSQEDELAREVSSRLAGSTAAGQDISVSSRDGVVTLHGRVDSVAVLEEAMNVASATPGVARVVSRLTVDPEAS